MPTHRMPLALLICVLSLLLGPGSTARASEPKPRPEALGLDWVGSDEEGRLIFRTAIGKVVVPAVALEREVAAVRRDLMASVARVRADAKGAALERAWYWQEVTGLGRYLTSGDRRWLVLPDALLRRQSVARRAVREERGAIRQATQKLRASIASSTTISPWMGGALDDVLARLAAEPGDPSKAELDPGFARRVVSEKAWLDDVAGEADAGARKAVQDALAAATKVSEGTRYAGQGWSISVLKNAWGSQGMVISQPSKTILTRTPPHPMDDGRRMEVLRHCRLVMELPAGSDPLKSPGVVRSAYALRLVRGHTTIAAWSKDAGFRSPTKVWRKHFPAPEGSYLKKGWPPHIPIVDVVGRLHGMAVGGGILRPVDQDSADGAERFLGEAARLLPDAAHLDLLQQYFLRYVWDSPDISRPLMLGCEKFHDEIHQTAAQTLRTCAGGICRGDCDDLAALIQEITRRQGKLSYVVNLPGHLAAVWLEKRGSRWHSYVLQSGPGHEFEADTLPGALEAAYLGLDPNAPFDRNNVSVSLRFPGQNTRATFGLSWRIFRDRDYADTMIDVQADWNRMTLLRAERKMLGIVKAGDTSTANYQELAALYDWMDRSAEAVRYDRLSLQRRKDTESTLLKLIELIDNLVDAGQLDEAKRHIDSILKGILPPLTEAIGLRALVIGVDFASTLATDAPALALQVLSDVTQLPAPALGGSLFELLSPTHKPEAWRKHASNEALQSLMETYAWTAIAVLKDLRETTPPAGPLKVVKRTLDTWLREHAFDDLDEPEAITDRWALRARRLAVDDPELLAKIADAPAPSVSRGIDHRKLARAAKTADVLSWTRASPWFFAYAINDIVAEEDERPDPKQIQLLGDLMTEAEGHARRLGLYGADTESEQRRARLRIALIIKDEDGLRAELKRVAALGDRYAFESTSSALGWAAVHLDMDWWKTVVGVWVEEIDNPINYFNIVWRAIGMKAPQHALYVAELAAKRYPADSAIQEELGLLRELLAK